MTGCRHGAKNTLTTNYLGLAERAGAQVHPLTTVTDVRPRRRRRLSGRHRRAPRGCCVAGAATFTAEHVVFSAGTYNTQKLLHELQATATLPGISDRLGQLTRTNSESLLGAVSSDRAADFTQGVAITSSWHPDENTHIEPCRYGKGSNAMGLLTTALTDGGTPARGWRAVVVDGAGGTRTCCSRRSSRATGPSG